MSFYAYQKRLQKVTWKKKWSGERVGVAVALCNYNKCDI